MKPNAENMPSTLSQRDDSPYAIEFDPQIIYKKCKRVGFSPKSNLFLLVRIIGPSVDLSVSHRELDTRPTGQTCDMKVNLCLIEITMAL